MKRGVKFLKIIDEIIMEKINKKKLTKKRKTAYGKQWLPTKSSSTSYYLATT
jgi:hypothetical protein